MKPAKFDYARAGDLADAIRLLGSTDGFNKPLGGGMSLGPMMNLRLAQPDLVVEVRKLDALKAVTEEGGHLVVGAGITHAEIEDGKIPDTANGMMRFVAGQIAYRAVRNRGTVGGSIAHADPAADWPTALRALGAEVTIDGPDGARVVPLSEFQLAAFTVALEPADIVTALRIPRLSPGAKWGYYKICRKPGEFADSIGAVVHDPERGRTDVVLGATDGAPLDVPALAEAVRAGTAVEIDDAKAALAAQGAVFDDYGNQIHAVALSRAIKGALAS